MGTAQLESANRLQILKLKKKPALLPGARPFQQGSADGDATEESLGGANVVEGDHHYHSKVSPCQFPAVGERSQVPHPCAFVAQGWNAKLPTPRSPVNHTTIIDH
jgi:hypothetical protein